MTDRRMLVVRLKVVSPLFLGEADNANAELRPPSLKGALRFWWRAVQSSAVDSQMLASENRIFGGAGRDEGQSSVLITTVPNSVQKAKGVVPKPKPLNQQNAGVGYMGYGLPERECIQTDSQFTLRLLFRDESFREPVLRSLWALTHFGGLGARSRRGFGSVVVVDTSELGRGWALPQSQQELAAAIQHFLRNANAGSRPAFPEYSAFSSHSRVYIGSPRPTWKAVLDGMGAFLGQAGRTPGGAFTVGHRYILGLPRRPHPLPLGISRRASPLLVHCHPLAGGEVVPVLTLLPARFLPSGPAPQWSALRQLLAGMSGFIEVTP